MHPETPQDSSSSCEKRNRRDKNYVTSWTAWSLFALRADPRCRLSPAASPPGQGSPRCWRDAVTTWRDWIRDPPTPKRQQGMEMSDVGQHKNNLKSFLMRADTWPQ